MLLLIAVVCYGAYAVTIAIQERGSAVFQRHGYQTLREDSVLTTDYVASDTIRLTTYDKIGLFFNITKNNLSTFQYKVQWSPDNITWYDEVTETIAAGSITNTVASYTITPSDDTDFYTLYPYRGNYLRVQVKGTSSGGGGTLTKLADIDDGDPAIRFSLNVWCDGTYIYLANASDGLRAYTFNGTAFTATGDIADTGAIYDVWGDGTYIYGASYGSGIDAYSYDGATFTNLDNYEEASGTSRGVWGDGTYVYLANYNDGLRAYTFDGATLSSVGHIDDGGYANGVWCDGTYIYLANDTDGLRAYTFDGSTFTNVGHIDDGGYAKDVWGDGTYIYLANYTDGLRAYTFDGATFTNVGYKKETVSRVNSVWGDGTYIYVANLTDGMRVYTFDGSTFTGIINLSEYGRGVHGDGTYIYLASYTDGLYAYGFISELTASCAVYLETFD